MAVRMVFMGSDPIALPSLNAIVEGCCGEIELVSVFTQPDRARGRGQKVVANGIKRWALDRGIPVHQPEKVGKAERLQLASQSIDSILVMAYGHLLSEKLIATPPLGIWNLHTSLLPKYRGASPIQCAVASGDSETGVSLMKMVRQMDAGPVLDVEKVCIEDEDTALDVEEKLSQACVPLLERGLRIAHAGNPLCTEQDESEATYVRKLGKEDGELDFHVSAEVLAKRVNGLFPWPGTRANWGELAIKIGLAVADVEDSTQAEPGTIVAVEKDTLRVACGKGTVLFKRLQRPGGKMLPAAEFLRGFELPVGSRFESQPMSELVKAANVRE